MSLKTICRSVFCGLTVAATSSAAWAGCNCGVPPAPATAMPVAMGSWPVAAPAPQYHHVMSPGGYAGSAYGGQLTAPALYGQPMYGQAAGAAGPTWAPGGYEPRVGSPVYYHDPAGGQYQVSGNPYNDHFGPGFHRDSLHGHYRFPYYTYRAPWYYPGRAVYNRDTNFPW